MECLPVDDRRARQVSLIRRRCQEPRPVIDLQIDPVDAAAVEQPVEVPGRRAGGLQAQMLPKKEQAGEGQGQHGSQDADQINVPVADKAKKEALMSAQSLWDAVAEQEATLADTGRILVRPSGTEALIRVMVEAQTEENARKIAEKLANIIKNG